VGYARISTDDQTTALQADALARAAVDVVFEEEASGANTARPVLAKTLAALRSGDTLVVWRLDRLGRSLGHLIEVATVLRERGVFLRSLTEGFDTSTASGRLLYHVLVLLCYEVYAMDCSFAVRAYAGRWQHGQWVSRLLSAIAIRTRIVAIECGTWRCVLTGRAAWSEIVGYCRLRESHTPPSGGGKTSLIDQEESVSCDAERCVVVKASPTSPFVLI
jgi:hypothetical protein